MNEITRILLSDMPLAISETGYRYLLATAYPKTFDTLLTDIPLHKPTHGDFVSTTPLYGAAATTPLYGAAATVPGDFVAGHPYAAATHSHLRTLAAQTKDIPLTDDFTSESTPDNTIAYHRIFGPILADAYWHFSSKRFEQDLIAAEENPQIIAHLLHVNSPGGEAYYLDRLGETMDNCQKPIIAIIEEACSAAYNIACHAQAIYATTQFDLVGCIGTMVSFYDYSEFYAKMGIKRIEAKADKSDLKNATVEELIDGKPKKFIQQVLNPMNESFLATVQSHRSALAKAPDDSPVLRGETFFTDEALSIGLIDGRLTFADAAAEAHRRGTAWRNTARLATQLYKLE